MFMACLLTEVEIELILFFFQSNYRSLNWFTIFISSNVVSAQLADPISAG